MQAVRLFHQPAKAWYFHTRLASSSAGNPRPDRAYVFVRILLRSSGAQEWHLLRNLAHPHYLTRLLSRNTVRNEVFDPWKPILRSSDLQYVVQGLQKRGFLTALEEWDQDRNPVPSWLLLYLSGFKVRTAQQASTLLPDLAFSNMNHLAPQIKGGLLILAVLQFARHNVLVHIKTAVDEFLTITHPPNRAEEEAVQYNLMLQAISRNQVRSQASADIAISILRFMSSRAINLHEHTYLMLLDDRFVTLQLTKYLRTKMIREKKIPSAAHLEAYVKVFAKNGLIEDPKSYHEALRPIKQSLLLAAEPDTASAFEFLRKLSPKQPSNVFRAGPRRYISIADFTSTFRVAAKDIPATTADKLIEIFESAISSRTLPRRHSFRPTVVTYTVLIYGLMSRGAYEEACQYWHKMLDSGITIDGHALSIGVQALTRAGKPHRAFLALESHAKDYPLNVEEMNHFLVCLLRIHRPDVVFALWDGMSALYDLQPTEKTLSLVLQAARLAMNMDDTVSGYFRTWLDRGRGKYSDPTDKKIWRERIKSLLLTYEGEPEPDTLAGEGLKPYKSGIWAGSPSATTVKQVFYKVLESYRPSIADVRHPVFASPRDPHKDQLWTPNLSFLLSNTARDSSVYSRHYPALVPSDANFKELLILLGTSPVTPPEGELGIPDIPLILAWMREVNVLPSKDTMAIALVLFREWNAEAPLVQAVNKYVGARDPYKQLVDWMEDVWSHQALPREGYMMRWAVKIEKMRMSRRTVVLEEGEGEGEHQPAIANSRDSNQE